MFARRTALLLSLFAVGAQAAPTTYEFDVVTSIDMHVSLPSVTGVLKNSTAPTTISFQYGGGDYSFGISRCVPLFLTAMEKPGRYLLTVTTEPAYAAPQLISCGLQLKS